MADRRPTLKQRLDFAGLYFVFLLGRLLPRRTFVRLGSWVGRFVFDVLRIRRAVTLTNLRLAFGDRLSEPEIVRLGRRAYGQLGSCLLEFCSLWGMDRQERLDAVDFVNLEAIDRVIAEGRGCMLVTGHFGSWELFGAAFAARGYKTTFIVKEQKNPQVAAMQNELRRRGGIQIVKEGPLVARGVLRAIRDGHLVGILPDQDARRHGVFVEFLGRPASTYRGPAFFALRANVPIITAYVRRKPDGNHVGTIFDPIYPDPTADEETEIQRLTQAYTDLMTEWIREHPEHYFWVHRRWKTQPDGSQPYAELAARS